MFAVMHRTATARPAALHTERFLFFLPGGFPGRVCEESLPFNFAKAVESELFCIPPKAWSERASPARACLLALLTSSPTILIISEKKGVGQPGIWQEAPFLQLRWSQPMAGEPGKFCRTVSPDSLARAVPFHLKHTSTRCALSFWLASQLGEISDSVSPFLFCLTLW